MNDAVKLEARLLTAAELELVAVTRPPEIERQSVDELKAAARRLREAHDRAKAIGTRQAREMRGKAEPRGATLAKDNSGTVGKAQALREALDRVEAELAAATRRLPSRVPRQADNDRRRSAALSRSPRTWRAANSRPEKPAAGFVADWSGLYAAPGDGLRFAISACCLA